MPKQFLNYGFGIVAALAGLLSTTVHADFIGLYASVDGVYSQTSINDNQATDDKWNAVYNVAFEHPVPFVPNLKLRYSEFGGTRNDFQSGIYFVDQDLDVNTLDAIAYYEILDNIVSVDAGLGVKRLDVTNTLTTTVPGINLTLSDDKQTLPALYIAAGGKLPFTGFSAKAEVMAGQNSDADFSDINAEVKYNVIQNIALDLGVKFGYRAMTINFDDDSSTNFDKIEAKGPYLGLEAHF